MVYNHKTWGTYDWDPNKSLSENVTAAQVANALIRTEDLQKYEDAIRSLTDNQVTLSVDPETNQFTLTTPDLEV